MVSCEVSPQDEDAVVMARAELESVRGRTLSNEALIASSHRVAEGLARAAQGHHTRADRSRLQMLSRLMDDPPGQALSTLMTDRVYRSATSARTLTAVNHLVEALGAPAYMSGMQRLQLRMAMIARWAIPDVVARGMLREMHAQSADLVLPADPGALRVHLTRRAAESVRMNLNLLGEAVLGEDEAQRRVDGYVELLGREEVRTVSVKISSIASQIDLLAFEHTLDVLRPRLRRILRAARDGRGTGGPKLVNLDMEAYRDLELTYALLTSVLEESEFRDLTAGMVLQAYLPDSAQLQRTLTDWARARVAAGGAPMRLRIVKGANLAAERTQASLTGWPLPIYGTKAEVDANFKRMVDYGTLPEHIDAVRLGVATHNIFDLAYGLVRSAERDTEAHVECELLEGMAEPLRRAVQRLDRRVLLYGPVVDDAQMQSAIAYLMRRLDENTAPENFLHHSFAMRVGDSSWDKQRALFDDACARREEVPGDSLRTQDRTRESAKGVEPTTDVFRNCPDTDFSLARNRAWMDGVLQRWHDRPTEVLDPQSSSGDRRGDGFDPSRPGHVPYRFALVSEAGIERVIDAAAHGRAAWAGVDVATRAKVLGRVAHGLRAARGELIGVLVLDAGKRVQQADTEVSEAVDFAEYYRRSALQWYALPHVRARPRGVVLITPPWNFPLAIAAGGVLAALAAGNTVILKPALETVWVAHELANICWEAGVPKDALQLCVCTDELGSKLIADTRIDSVVLTGASSTARLFQRIRPGLHLLAETGGKNALILSAMSDRDQAVFDAVHGAFAHAGQKCSATSLLVCEREVYEDAAFQRQLRDAAASLPLGSAWDSANVVTPLIAPPAGALQREMGQLQGSQTWLLEPRVDPHNPRIVSPGIKLGVERGHDAHGTELFGPLLSVMCADDLYDAIEIANGTEYGLTSGLHSLDEREQGRWFKRIRAGNLYINRGTTGAIVQRQPFGGLKRSSFGPSAKAGGPDYIAQLLTLTQDGIPPVDAPPREAAAALIADTGRYLDRKAQERVAAATCDYGKAWAHHFGVPLDPSAVIGELNVSTYRGASPMVVRVANPAEPATALMACAAALTVDAGFALSCSADWAARYPFMVSLTPVPHVVETDAELAERIEELERIRLVGELSVALLDASMAAGVHIGTGPVLGVGRVELLHYVREQSLSIAYHRHGNLAGATLQPYPQLLPVGVVEGGE